jgi:hypothetical protein
LFTSAEITVEGTPVGYHSRGWYFAVETASPGSATFAEDWISHPRARSIRELPAAPVCPQAALAASARHA